MALSLFALVISASQTSSPPIQLWNQFQGGDPYIPYAKLSPDHKLLLSMYDDNPRVWDVKTGMLLFVIPGPGKVVPAAFSADDSRLAIADFKGVRVWNVKTGKPACKLNLNLGEDDCQDVGISPDGSHVYCRGSDGVLDFSGTTGKLIRRSNLRSWRNLAIASKDGFFEPSSALLGNREVAIDGRDIVIRRARSGRLIRRIKTGAARLTGTWFINNDSEVLTTARGDGAKVWDPKTGRFKRPFGEPFATMEDLTIQNGTLQTVAPSGKAIAWRLQPFRRFGSVIASFKQISPDIVKSPDGTRILKLGWPAELEVVGTDGAKFDLSDADGGEFSREGKFLVTWAHDQNPKVRDGRDGHSICELRPSSTQISSVCFSPLGAKIAAGGSDGRISIWDAVSGRLLQAGPKFGGWINSITYGTDGRIYGIVDDTVVAIDPLTLKPILKVAQYLDGSWIVLTPDGKFDSSAGSCPKFGHIVVPAAQGLTPIPFSKLGPLRLYVPGLAARVLGPD